MSIGVQSCLSESGSFIEDDNHEQLTLQNFDAIKIMADVEEDIRRQFSIQVKDLKEELRKKQYQIDELNMKKEKVTVSEVQLQDIMINTSAAKPLLEKVT